MTIVSEVTASSANSSVAAEPAATRPSRGRLRPRTTLNTQEPSTTPTEREGTKTTSVTLPGLPAIVPAARRLVRALLAGTPRAADMELVACEIITLFMSNTHMGDEVAGLTFTLHTALDWARVEVTSSASSNRQAEEVYDYPNDGYLYSMRIIDGLSDKWAGDGIAQGTTVNGHTLWTIESQTVWAQVSWRIV
jgi:hypothetical protein